MTASLEIVNASMHSRDTLNYEEDRQLKLAKEDISSSSSDPPETNEEWNRISKPTTHDVLLGRGGGTNNHNGNVKFRKLVNEHKMRYLACSKVEKPKVAREVVHLWRKMEPPGRFLSRLDETKRGAGSVKATDNVWFEVGDKKAREKASQCLRERTPEVMPYIKQLREQQDAMTEQGVSMVERQIQMHKREAETQQMDAMAAYNLSVGAGVVAVAQAHAFPRRNSMPVPHDPNQQHLPQSYMGMGRRTSMPSMSQGPPQPTSYNTASRTSSLPVIMSGNATHEEFYPAGPPAEDDFFGGMSDQEYEHMMMMQQQQLQMQHIQLQRMRQQRMRATAAAAAAEGVAATGGRFLQRAMPGGAPASTGAFGAHPTSFLLQQQHAQISEDPLPVQQDPLLLMTKFQLEQQQRQLSNARAPKRSPDVVITAVTPSPARHAKPDSAPSSTLAQQEPAAVEDAELTLEEYRQQLEQYMTSNQILDPPADHPEDDHGDNSDLEDDWEKERDRAVKKEKKRGVSRNVSGMSFMSAQSTGTKTDKSGGGMSLVSGMSNFSDIMSTATREQKMTGTRSVCSNLSLMSELSVLSQDMDDLHLNLEE